MSGRHHQEQRPAWWDEGNKRAMLIARISDKKQSDGVSLDSQRYCQEAYARESGLTVVAKEAFQESAKTSGLRVQFHAAIAKARRDVRRVPHPLGVFR